MKNIFQLDNFQFPYEYKFPGQASDERILYITRENKLLLLLRKIAVVLVVAIILVVGLMIKRFLQTNFDIVVGLGYTLALVLLAITFLTLGWWWVISLWKKSIAVLTTRRLIKFIYTTPASRHSLILPLEMVVDTGAYTKGFIQSFLGLGTFTARSSASSSGVATDDPSRVNKKYFYIENIRQAEDLQHYMSKVLAMYRERHPELNTFRPFLPDLKGEARANFIKENFPQYWS